MTPGQVAASSPSSFAAGVMNAMAGGGTILTYPDAALPRASRAITANATSTVALWPGAAASLFGYRRGGRREPRLAEDALPAEPARRSARRRAAPADSVRRRSAHLAPFLILFATILFTLQGAVARWTRLGARRRRGLPGGSSLAVLFQFVVGDLRRLLRGRNRDSHARGARASSGSPTSTPPTASRISSGCASTESRPRTSSLRGAVEWRAASIMIAGGDRRRLRGRAVRPTDRKGQGAGGRHRHRAS